MESSNYQCPACNGPLHFDAALGKLKCDYCDSTFTADEAKAYLEKQQKRAEEKAQAAKTEEQRAAEQAERDARLAGDVDTSAGTTDNCASADTSNQERDPIQAYLDSKKPLSEDDPNANAVSCESCGATLIVSDVSAVTTCPYCGNNSIIPGKLGGALEPDYLIPFSITKEQAIAKLKDHYKGKICLPRVFSEQNHLEEIQGVYVPFWLYDGACSGSADFTCTNVRVFTDGKWEVTETDTWNVHRAGDCGFARVPADASKRMPNNHMDSIEPYDFAGLVPFNTSYLPGFAAERYDDEVADCASRVKTRMANSLEEGLRDSVGPYTNVIASGSNATETISKVSYALLPVWLLHTKWQGQDFLFAVNGQTGKLVGDLPTDKKKLNLLTLAGLVAGFAVGALLTGLFIA